MPIAMEEWEGWLAMAGRLLKAKAVRYEFALVRGGNTSALGDKLAGSLGRWGEKIFAFFISATPRRRRQASFKGLTNGLAIFGRRRNSPSFKSLIQIVCRDAERLSARN